MEFCITITVAEHGFDPENGNRFLQGFLVTTPEAGAAVSQDTETGLMTVTFSVDAPDLPRAMRAGEQVFARGADASGLVKSEILGATIYVVTDDSELEKPVRELHREPVAACR